MSALPSLCTIGDLEVSNEGLQVVEKNAHKMSSRNSASESCNSNEIPVKLSVWENPFMYIKQSWKKVFGTDHPAAFQKTPFNLNRFVLLASYCYLSFMTSAVYLNWTPMANMMFKNNAFSHLCKKGADGEYVDDLRRKGNTYICNEQEATVNNLLTIVTASHCICGMLGGFLLDTVGMSITSMTGLTMQTVAWVLLAFSSESFSAYYAALVILGMGCDPSFLPTLIVSNLFPGNAALIITCLGSASSLSFQVPVIVQASMQGGMKYRDAMLAYIGYGLVPCLLIAAFLMPCRNFKGMDKYPAFNNKAPEEDIPEPEVVGAIENVEQSATVAQKPKKEDSWLEGATMAFEMELVEDVEPTTKKTGETENTSSCLENRDLEALPRLGSHNSAHREIIEKKVSDAEAVELTLKQQALSIPYIGFVLYFVVSNVMMVYYLQGSGTRLYSDEKCSDALTILIPLSCIPCIIFGRLMDVFGVMKIALSINFCLTLGYFFAIFRTVATGMISAILFVCFLSMVTSQISCFIEFVFDSKHFGRLFGLCSAVGGAGAFIVMPIYKNVTVGALGGNIQPSIIVFTVIGSFNFVILGVVWGSLKKSGKI